MVGSREKWSATGADHHGQGKGTDEVIRWEWRGRDIFGPSLRGPTIPSTGRSDIMRPGAGRYSMTSPRHRGPTPLPVGHNSQAQSWSSLKVPTPTAPGLGFVCKHTESASQKYSKQTNEGGSIMIKEKKLVFL